MGIYGCSHKDDEQNQAAQVGEMMQGSLKTAILWITFILTSAPIAPELKAGIIHDPDHTIANNLSGYNNIRAIDHFMTWYDTQPKRHEKVIKLCKDGKLRDDLAFASQQASPINIVIGSCDELLKSLLTQLDYLNKGYTTNRQLFGDLSEPSRGIRIKDLQMRILGAIHSLLNPESGGDLNNQSYPSDTSSLFITLNQKVANDIVTALLEMANTMQGALYVYEYIEDYPLENQPAETITLHPIYTVPALWTAIINDLSSYQLIEPLITPKLERTMQNMFIAHYQAKNGIRIFQSGISQEKGDMLLKETGYRIACTDEDYFRDMHGSSSISFKAPGRADHMSIATAETAQVIAEKFLIDYGIDIPTIKTNPERYEIELNITMNQILIERALKYIGQ